MQALERWLAHVRTVVPGYDRGPLFLRLDAAGRVRLGRLSARGVARVVQRWVERAGLDPARFAGHSLRAGLATSAAAGGVSERAIMNQTGHRSLAMVRRYIRDGELFGDDNAARGAGLQHEAQVFETFEALLARYQSSGNGPSRQGRRGQVSRLSRSPCIRRSAMVARAGVSWRVGATDSVADAGGWSRLQMAYLPLGDNEARRLMEEVAE